MKTERHDWLLAHQVDLDAERLRWRRVEVLWSWARLITFFAGSYLCYRVIDTPWAATVVAALSVGAFAWTVGRHRAGRERRELVDRALLIVKESLKRCGGHITLVRSGERPVPATDPTAALAPVVDDGPVWTLTGQEREDLDLYSGPVGVFGLLNRTSTLPGARRLRDMLDRPCVSVGHIRARQHAVQQLEQNTPERIRIMAGVAALRGHDVYVDALASAISRAAPLPRPMWVWGLRWWSLVSCAVALYALIQAGRGAPRWLYVLLALLAFNGMILRSLQVKLRECLTPFKTVFVAAKGYLQAANHAVENLPDDALSSRLREHLEGITASDVLPSLCKRLPWADSGGAFHTLSNLLVFYDLHVTAAILNRAVPHRDLLLAGFSALAEVEALCSLACFAYESSDGFETCYPVLVEHEELSITNGKHPLIPQDRAVANSLHLTPRGRLRIITGSNMAGKSTLLRMCGVNNLLAQIGTVALAERMRLSPMRLMTDLRVSDNLAGNESYFLAEVRHLRRMVRPHETGGTVLGLVDEPFRGTNTTDQVAAGVALVEHLLGTGHFFLIATHEMALSALADRHDAAANLHFREDLGADGLTFDYRLREGPAETRNALQILAREGYPETVLQRARQWLDQETTDGPGRGEATPPHS